MILDATLIVCRFVHYAGTLGLFGILLFPFYAGRFDDPGGESRLRALSLGAGLVSLISGVGWFVFTSASMAGDLASAIDPQVLLQVVSGTDFGPLWLARLGLIALGLVVTASSWRAGSRFASLCLTGLALAGVAGAGHARVTQGWAGAVHLTADAVHLLAAGAWLGGLIPLGLAVNRWLARPLEHQAAAAHTMLRRFSGMGSLAVAALIVSGVINGWFLVGSISALWSTTYGRLLTAKVVLFAGMVALAGANRFWITPRIARASSDIGAQFRALRRHVIGEQALGLIVVAIVSVLGTLQTAI